MDIKKLLNNIRTSRTYKYIVTIGLGHANAFLIGLFLIFAGLVDGIMKNSINASGGAAVMGAGFLFFLIVMPITIILILISPIILLVDLFKPLPENENSDFLPKWIQIISIISFLVTIAIIIKFILLS